MVGDDSAECALQDFPVHPEQGLLFDDVGRCRPTELVDVGDVL